MTSGAEVGEAPGDVGVVADDHARHAGEGEARDVERALGRHVAAVQADLHPDARHASCRGAGRWRGSARRSRSARRRRPSRCCRCRRRDRAARAAASSPSPHAGSGPRPRGRREVRRPLRAAGCRRWRPARRRRRRPRPARRSAGGRRSRRPGRARRPASGLSSTSASTRSISSFMLPRRSHAIALSQASESAGGPRLGLVVEPGRARARCTRGRARSARALVEVGVDALGVGLERGRGCPARAAPAPARRPRASRACGRTLSVSTGVLAEQLGQPAGGDVAAHVHLEEPLLGVHEALRAHQVGHRVGVELRDAVLVADHRRPSPSRPGELDLALGLRAAAGGRAPRPPPAPATSTQDQADGDVRRSRAAARQQPERCAPAAGSAASSVAGRDGGAVVMACVIVPYHWQSPRGVPARSQPIHPAPGTTRADLPVRLHRVRPRLRAGPELHRRRADRVPGVLGPAAQAVQRRGRGLQGLGLLPHRQPRHGGPSEKSASASESTEKRPRADRAVGLQVRDEVRPSAEQVSPDTSSSSSTAAAPAAHPPTPVEDRRPRRPIPPSVGAWLLGTSLVRVQPASVASVRRRCCAAAACSPPVHRRCGRRRAARGRPPRRRPTVAVLIAAARPAGGRRARTRTTSAQPALPPDAVPDGLADATPSGASWPRRCARASRSPTSGWSAPAWPTPTRTGRGAGAAARRRRWPRCSGPATGSTCSPPTRRPGGTGWSPATRWCSPIPPPSRGAGGSGLTGAAGRPRRRSDRWRPCREAPRAVVPELRLQPLGSGRRLGQGTPSRNEESP